MFNSKVDKGLKKYKKKINKLYKNLNGEVDKWYKVALKRYKRGKLEEPYNSLFDYYINMTVDYLFDSQYLNHFTYFFTINKKTS